MAATSNVKLKLSFNNNTKVALSIPLSRCTAFSLNPLKWLRFLGFAIYGQEGYLSTSNAGPEIDDYTADIEARSYYFISEGEPRLVDVDAIDDRTSDTSCLSVRRADFRQRMIDRDGTCVITNDIDVNCTACHILPHSKGNDYMSRLSRHRGETYALVDELNDIDDTRNGLLLAIQLHRPFGDGESAFLKTPNFALTVDDIPYHLPRQAHEDRPACRLTLHHFFPEKLGTVLGATAPHNSDAREPQDTSEWPPAIIVDLFYAAAAVRAWGPRTFTNYLRKCAKDFYYHNEGNGDSESDSGDIPPTARSARYAKRSEQKAQAAHFAEQLSFGDVMDGVMTLWMRSARKGQQKLPSPDALDVVRNQDNVQTWLQSAEGPI